MGSGSMSTSACPSWTGSTKRELATTFLIAAFFPTLRRAVIAGDARLHVANLTEGFDELVIDTVDHIAAD